MRIDGDLRLGSNGENVRKLHAALERMGLPIAKSELRNASFGKETRNAVEALQVIFEEKLRTLGWSGDLGVVDEGTARLIEYLLAQLPQGNEPRPAEPSSHRISGNVLADGLSPLSDATVKIGRWTLAGSNPIGTATCDDCGNFVLDFDLPRAESKSDRSAPGGRCEDKHADKLDLHLTILDNRKRERPIAAMVAIEGGNERAIPRIVETKEAPFLLVDAGLDVRLRVKVGEASGSVPLSEFEEVEARLAPHLHGLSYEDLEEEGGRFQISYLAATSGIIAAIIERLVASAKSRRLAEAEGEDLPIAAFYAFGHAGLSAALGELARLPRDHLASALGHAIADNVIPASLERDIERVVEGVMRLGVAGRLGEELGGGSGTIGDWLSLAGLKPEAQLYLLQLIADSGETGLDHVWARLGEEKAMGGAAAVRRAREYLQIAGMCGNHLELAKALVSQAETQIATAAELALLDQSQWLAAIDRAGLKPPPGRSRKVAAWRGNLADEMMRAAQFDYPTAALEPVVAKDHEAIGIAAATGTWLTTVRTAAAGGKAEPFDLRQDHIDRYFAGLGKGKAPRGQDEEKLRSDLKRLQRTLIIADEPRWVAPLLVQGHDSALRVAQMSADAFTAEHKRSIPEADAAAIHARARQVHLAHLSIHLAVGDAIATSRLALAGSASS